MLHHVQWAFGFFALGLGYLILAAIQAYSFARIGSNLGEKVRRLFYRAVIYMEVGWFDQDANTSGALSSRLASDAPMVRGAVSDVMGITIQNVVTFISAYVIAFVNGWRMTLLITAVLPLLGFSSWMQIKFFTGARRLSCYAIACANRVVALALCTVGRLSIQAPFISRCSPDRSSHAQHAIGCLVQRLSQKILKMLERFPLSLRTKTMSLDKVQAGQDSDGTHKFVTIISHTTT